MTITLTRDLEKVLKEIAQRRGIRPEVLALESLRAAFLSTNDAPLSDEDFEATVTELDTAMAEAGGEGVSPLPHQALTREGIYGDHA